MSNSYQCLAMNEISICDRICGLAIVCYWVNLSIFLFQFAVFRILYNHWSDFCQFRSQVTEDKVMPTIERHKRRAKAEEKRRRRDLQEMRDKVKIIIIISSTHVVLIYQFQAPMPLSLKLTQLQTPIYYILTC